MSEMVERVAEAMEAAAEADPGEIYEGGGWIDTPAWRTLARAAITAMREPIVSMVYAVDRPDCVETHEDIAFVWERMIDAALVGDKP